MESRAYALITGLFVLGIAGCIIAWAHWLARTPIARTDYRVVALGPVTGLNPEAQVRYRGMGVGRVSSIQLDAKDPRRILVNIEVNNEIPVTKGTYAQLGMEGITGIAYVHLLDDYKNLEPKEKGPDGVAELPLRPSFFDTVSSGNVMITPSRLHSSSESMLPPAITRSSIRSQLLLMFALISFTRTTASIR